MLVLFGTRKAAVLEMWLPYTVTMLDILYMTTHPGLLLTHSHAHTYTICTNIPSSVSVTIHDTYNPQRSDVAALTLSLRFGLH